MGLAKQKLEEATGIRLFRDPGNRGAVGPRRPGGSGGSKPRGCVLLWLTRSLPPVASLPPSVLKLQQFTGPLCPQSSVPQGKSSAFCGSVSNCLGHSRTVKSSVLEIRREEDSLKEEATQAWKPKTKAIVGAEGDI